MTDVKICKQCLFKTAYSGLAVKVGCGWSHFGSYYGFKPKILIEPPDAKECMLFIPLKGHARERRELEQTVRKHYNNYKIDKNAEEADYSGYVASRYMTDREKFN